MNIRKLLLFFVLAFALSNGAAEYISNGTFGSPFPTPPSGSYTNIASSGAGLWNTFYNVPQASAVINFAYGNVVQLGTNSFDLVSPTYPLVPSGASSTLLDLCGDLGPATIYQTRANLTIGSQYRLTIIAEATTSNARYGVYLTPPTGQPYVWGFGDGPFAFPSLPNRVVLSEEFYTYRGSGHPSTNSYYTPRVLGTVNWCTNTWDFTATSATWSLYLTGVGADRSSFIRNVSIQDAP